MPEASDDPEAELLPLPATAVQESVEPATADAVQDATLIFFGLDNAGKSTIMQVLTNDRIVAQQPTLHPSALQIVLNRIRFKAFDLAGHETGRRLWKEYFPIASAVCFLVDAADHSRFPEAAEELAGLRSEQMLQDVPIAVLGMKIDIAGAASADEFCKAMGLPQKVLSSSPTAEGLAMFPSKVSTDNMATDNIKVFMCSVVEMEGCHRIGEAINWLSEHILQHRAPAGTPVAIAEESNPADDMDMMV